MKHPSVSVKGVILDGSGRVLLSRTDSGNWGLPGGIFEGGEDWQTALNKRVDAAVGVKVKTSAVAGLYSSPGLAVVFVVKSFDGTPRPERNEWFPVDRLPPELPADEASHVRDVAKSKGAVVIQ